MSSITNREAMIMLEDFLVKCAASYPVEEPVDPRYCFAIGIVMGVCNEALLSVREGRPISLKLAGFKDAVLRSPDALVSSAES